MQADTAGKASGKASFTWSQRRLALTVQHILRHLPHELIRTLDFAGAVANLGTIDAQKPIALRDRKNGKTPRSGGAEYRFYLAVKLLFFF